MDPLVKPEDDKRRMNLPARMENDGENGRPSGHIGEKTCLFLDIIILSGSISAVWNVPVARAHIEARIDLTFLDGLRP